MNKKRLTSLADQNFWTRYKKLCTQYELCASKSIIKYFNGTELNISYLTMHSEHWLIFLEALNYDNSLTKISFNGMPPSQKMRPVVKSASSHSERIRRARGKMSTQVKFEECIENYILCLKNCLQISHTLQVLKLENITLTSLNIIHLAQGLLRNSTVRAISFKGSLDDSSTITLCDKMKNAYTIEYIDLSNCSLSTEGIKAVAKLIKHQCNKRLLKIWELSLRYKLPNLDILRGLRRISLNNIKIGDDGAEVLVNVLYEDLWIKAIDMQNCSIKRIGALAFKHLISNNCILEVLDLRNNPFSNSLWTELNSILEVNNKGKTLKYKWLSLKEKDTTVLNRKL